MAEPIPIPSEVVTAFERLPQYNVQAYDPVTNEFGFDEDGHEHNQMRQALDVCNVGDFSHAMAQIALDSAETTTADREQTTEDREAAETARLAAEEARDAASLFDPDGVAAVILTKETALINVVITATTAAVAGRRYICGMTGGAFTLPFPADPAEGTRISVSVDSTAEDNRLTIDFSGEAFDGSTDDLVIGIPSGWDFLFIDDAWSLI